jgi:undecaprenyl pyrophosphate synthase
MEKLIRKLSRLLARRFRGAELEIEQVGEDRVSGFLIWQGFTDLEQIERQRVLWRLLRRELTPKQIRSIAAIFTLTPQEMVWARAG